MANYYRTNAVYAELEKHGDVPFVWTSGNAWILLYADNSAHVMVVAFVSGLSTMLASAGAKSRLESARSKAVTLATAAGAAAASIQFDDQAATIESVLLDGRRVSLGELRDWFSKAGLAVSGPLTSKAINDAASSAYHQWQRSNLGAIKVSDIDLLRLDPNTRGVVEILELKRSYIPIGQWRPYQADYQNFNVVADLAARANVGFTIAYNLRVTRPIFRDDASLISRFAYSREAGVRPLGVVPFDTFLRGGPSK